MIFVRQDVLDLIEKGKIGPGGTAQIYIFNDDQVPDPKNVSHGDHKLTRVSILAVESYDDEDVEQVMHDLQSDLNAIILKCFGGKPLSDDMKEWLADLSATVIKYHSYKRGVIPYPDEEGEDE